MPVPGQLINIGTNTTNSLAIIKPYLEIKAYYIAFKYNMQLFKDICVAV